MLRKNFACSAVPLIWRTCITVMLLLSLTIPAVAASSPALFPDARAKEQASHLRFSDEEAAPQADAAAAKLDLIFVIDTTSSMTDDIAAVKASATEIVNAIATSGTDYRIGLVTYRDHPISPHGSPGDYPARIESGYTRDASAMVVAINGLIVAGGADFQESVYSGLITALGFPCRADAKRAIILMGDAPPHDPEPVTGYTMADVIAAARDACPESIYPVLIGSVSDPGYPETLEAFTELAEETDGELATADSAEEIVNAILEVLGSILRAPVALPGGPYFAEIGEAIQFDGSASYDPDGTITEYAWDFDNDGAFDYTSATSTVTYTYTTQYVGTVILQVTDDEGTTGTGVAEVTVADKCTLDLPDGWALISLCLEPARPNIGMVLRDAAGYVERVLSFENGALTYYPDGGQFNTLTSADAEHGYWINLDSARTVNIYGDEVPLNRSIELEEGWNLVSYLPNTPLPVTDALTSIAEKYDKVLGYDSGATSFYTAIPPPLNTLSTMEQDRGYWIHMTEPGTLDYSQAPTGTVSARAMQVVNQPQQTGSIAATNEWINVYSTNSTYNGQPLPVGTVITAIGEDGRPLGQVTVREQGWYGVLAVYRDDGYTPEQDGARSGEYIRFLVNGQPATITNGVEPTWTANGDLVQVDLAATGPAMDNHLYLPSVGR